MPSTPYTNACRNSEKSRAPDALFALVRLLAQHAAVEAIERVGSEQPACTKTLHTDTGALNDV
jgi:hypothetical protein